VQGAMRNRRGPSVRPTSGRGGSYKPKAKSSAGQRESEGVVVPAMAAKNNAAGGKGPCGGHVDGEGKREGMARETGPNHPGPRRPRDKVRDRKSTRLNSSHVKSSYAVFCLKKKNRPIHDGSDASIVPLRRRADP